MKDIYQLNNLLNLTSEINHPLNKTHRIKVSSTRLCDAFVYLFLLSTVYLLRCVAEFHRVWCNIGQHLPIPTTAMQISAIDSEYLRANSACGHFTAGALCGVYQSQRHDTGVCYRFGRQRAAIHTLHILSRNDNHSTEVATK